MQLPAQVRAGDAMSGLGGVCVCCTLAEMKANKTELSPCC